MKLVIVKEDLPKDQFVKQAREILVNEQKYISSKQVEDTIDPGSDDVDAIQAKILALVASKLSSRDKDSLKKIKVALKKIDEGSFGSCENCGENIDQKRLLFNPKFENCISCAEEIELLIRKGLK